jgi:hypothetical protein
MVVQYGAEGVEPREEGAVIILALRVLRDSRDGQMD